MTPLELSQGDAPPAPCSKVEIAAEHCGAQWRTATHEGVGVASIGQPEVDEAGACAWMLSRKMTENRSEAAVRKITILQAVFRVRPEPSKKRESSSPPSQEVATSGLPAVRLCVQHSCASPWLTFPHRLNQCSTRSVGLHCSALAGSPPAIFLQTSLQPGKLWMRSRQWLPMTTELPRASSRTVSSH